MKYGVVVSGYEDGGDLGGEDHRVTLRGELVEAASRVEAIDVMSRKLLDRYVLPLFWVSEEPMESVPEVSDYVLEEVGDLDFPESTYKYLSDAATEKLETSLDFDTLVPPGFRRVTSDEIPLDVLAISDSDYVEGIWMVTFGGPYFPERLMIIGPSVDAMKDAGKMSAEYDDGRMGDYLAALTGDMSEYLSGPGWMGTYHPSEVEGRPVVDLDAIRARATPTAALLKHKANIERGWKWRYTCRLGGVDGEPNPSVDPRPFV